MENKDYFDEIDQFVENELELLSITNKLIDRNELDINDNERL